MRVPSRKHWRRLASSAVIARSVCDEAIQLCDGRTLDCFAGARNDGEILSSGHGKCREDILKQKKFGHDGPKVSAIGQGTWYIDRGDRRRAVAALRRGIDLGMSHIDTAEMYGDSELVIA